MTAPVPVLWWNANPDERIIARGYWDQGLLEGLFSGDVWVPPGGFRFTHEVVARARVSAPPEPREGAVIVVPARHNAGFEQVAALQVLLSRLGWALVILTGDEEGAFPFRMLRHPRMVLWVMTPQAGVEYPPGTRFLGSGWPPGIRDVLRDVALELPAVRPQPWAFLGQDTHSRRHELVEMLRGRDDLGSARLLCSAGFTQGLPQAEYWTSLACARVAPCPSGPVSPDSMRLYEALEAGCVPLADDLSPRSTGPEAYWERLFGSVPFPLVGGPWADESATIDRVLAEGSRLANRVFAWWQREKRRFAWQLHEDVARISGRPPSGEGGPETAITALITTSPCPVHPSTEHLEQTVASIVDRLPGAEIVLAFDGVRPELEHRRGDYEEYQQRALWLANTRWRNVVPVRLEEWRHQAGLTAAALDEVRTRHLLFVEHDAPLVGDVDWAGIVAVLDSGELDMVRLHHETAIGEPHRHMMLDGSPRRWVPDAHRWAGPGEDGVPFVRTCQWSQRPHVAGVGWYRSVLRRHFSAKARTMIEDVMHGVCAVAWNEYGIAGWSRFRLALYAPPDNMQRSVHLDSRRWDGAEDPKGEMLFDYDGDAPEGAPRPGRRTT